MPNSQESAIRAIEKSLTLMHSVQTLQGTDKDGVEHLLEMAVETSRDEDSSRAERWV